jgi:predicted HD phosphohydrolase
LCAVEPSYRAALSPASEHSLVLQGGPFTAAEAAAFREGPHASSAISLRRWDDEAKVPGMKLTALSHYRPIIMAAMAGSRSAPISVRR